MITILILAYLLIGFGVAVGIARWTDEFDSPWALDTFDYALMGTVMFIEAIIWPFLAFVGFLFCVVSALGWLLHFAAGGQR